MNILTLTPSDDVEQAINSLKGPATVYLKNGVYKQKTEISADNVTIIGESRENTVITFDDYAKKIHADGKEYNTFRTYTLCISGNGVRLENLTVENSNTDPANVGQCVALSVHGRLFSAENVNLVSTQDTLFLSPFPDDLVIRYRNFIPANQLYREGTSLHLFKNCKISGTVDFIFGCSEAYFKGCKIISLDDGRSVGFIAAPAHPLAEEHGFTFLDCEILSGGAKKATNYLARPWRDFGKCNFINCAVGEHINPELFDKWNDTERDKTARFNYYNLNCNFSPAPVSWCRELGGDEVKQIIARLEKKIKEYIK